MAIVVVQRVTPSLQSASKFTWRVPQGSVESLFTRGRCLKLPSVDSSTR